jgi:hypothetical protein
MWLKVEANFGHQFHTPEQEEMSTSAYVPEDSSYGSKISVYTPAAVQRSCVRRDCCLLVGRPQLTGRHYRDILLYDLPELLEDAPQAVRARIWYMRDGAPAHCSRAVRDAVNNNYHGGWTGTGGAIEWPPRSTPDLNPLELYLCGHLNALVYTAPVDNGEILHHHTVDGCQTIHNCPGVFARMRRSMTRRVEARTESYEGHFEQVLLQL